MRIRIINFISVATLLLAGNMAQGQVLRMLPKAQVEGTVVRVADVATLEGFSDASADQVAKCVVIDNLKGAGTVRPEDVLFALISDGEKTMALGLQIHGAAACQVRLEGASEGPAPAVSGTVARTPSRGIQPVAAGATSASAEAGASAQATSQANIVTSVARSASVSEATKNTSISTKSHNPSLADLLRTQVIDGLSAAPDDVRMSFQTNSPLLHQEVGANQRWAVHPLGRNLLGTLIWEAQLLEDDKLKQHLSVTAYVERCVSVAICMEPLAVGSVVTPPDVRIQQHWVDRRIPTQFTRVDDVVGQVAVRAIGVDGVLDQRDFKPLELVAMGELTTIYAVNDNMQVRMSARSLKGGKLHERVKFRNERTGDQIEATIIGRGVAVVGTIDEPTETKLREAR